MLKSEQDRIVCVARLAKPLGSGGSLGKTHCYQGLAALVLLHLEHDRPLPGGYAK